MLDNFEPQEKKAIIIFIALLLLGLVYVGTHELQWESLDRGSKTLFRLKKPQTPDVFFEALR